MTYLCKGCDRKTKEGSIIMTDGISKVNYCTNNKCALMGVIIKNNTILKVK